MVQRRSRANDVMISQETGVSAGPATVGCVTLGKALPLSGRGGGEPDFQLCYLMTLDIGARWGIGNGPWEEQADQE